MSKLHLNDLSKIYIEQIAEKKDDSYLETDMKKRQKNNEKARKDMKKMGSMSNPHFGDGPTGSMSSEEVEVDEAMSSYDRNRKRAAQRAADRNAARAAGKTGVVPGVGYVSPRKERETYVDSAGTTRHKSGAKMEEYVTELSKKTLGSYVKKASSDAADRSFDHGASEKRQYEPDADDDKETSKLANRQKGIKRAVNRLTKEGLDPVGKEDGDVNNDGKKDSTDSYLMKRRKAIGKAMAKESLVISNWRNDLSEVMTDIESKPIKEKKVKNTVKINPKMGEAVEQMGGELIEMTEVDEGVRDMDPKKGTAERKARLEKKRGMKMDDHPEYKEEASMSPQEIALQKRKAMIDKMIATKRMQGLKSVKKSEAPTKAMGEGKELSIDDQMRISREAAKKRKPFDPKARERQRAAQIRQMAKNAPKDTRTDAQKMADATGPRPGSRYRGD